MTDQNKQGSQSGAGQNQAKPTSSKTQQSQQKQAAQHIGDGPAETETGAEDRRPDSSHYSVSHLRPGLAAG